MSPVADPKRIQNASALVPAIGFRHGLVFLNDTADRAMVPAIFV
jgi:hypothetical protein